jgi:aspartate carbamoyltransferase regulatory subunit
LKFKDLIKVENRELTPEEISKLAILAPDATINIIRNFQIYKKFHAELPEIISYVIVCPNPKCITNHERMETRFHVKPENRVVKLKCHYCEKTFAQNEIKDYNS